LFVTTEFNMHCLLTGEKLAHLFALSLVLQWLEWPPSCVLQLMISLHMWSVCWWM